MELEFMPYINMIINKSIHSRSIVLDRQRTIAIERDAKPNAD